MKHREQLLTLATVVREELRQLAALANDTEEAWKACAAAAPDVQAYVLESVALKLHHFYTACERVFEEIATEINGAVPRTHDWHVRLLRTMALAVPQVRPAVLTGALERTLEEYLKFRHLVRNLYTAQLDPERMRPLIEGIRDVSRRCGDEVGRFADYLEKLAAGIGDAG